MKRKPKYTIKRYKTKKCYHWPSLVLSQGIYAINKRIYAKYTIFQ